MIDICLVIVTTDNDLVGQFTKITDLKVFHVDGLKESIDSDNYDAKIIILDAKHTELSHEVLSKWKSRSSYLICLTDADTKINIDEHLDLFSDFWFKPIDLPILQKRIVLIADYLQLCITMSLLSGLTGHEVNMPLASVRGYSDVLLSGLAGDLSEQQQNFIQTIKRSAGKARQMFEELRTISRITTNAYQSYFETVELQSMLDSLHSEYEFAVSIDDDLRVIADESKLYRVFADLIISASNNSGDTLPHIAITTSDEFAKVKVSSEEEFINIYEDKFYFKGFILEALIFSHIIQEHGGQISFKSSPETGSIVIFTIPIAKEDTSK